MPLTRKNLIPFLIFLFPLWSVAQENKTSFEIHGFITGDAGYTIHTIDPNWYDVMRPTKLPSYPNQFAPDGTIFFSVRQSRFGVRSSTPTSLGELKTQFEFDLFGFGKDAGQTTLHLINAYAQLGKIGIGQTASVFMDLDVFPVTLDYWGPMSRIFNFNIQLRYTPIQRGNEILSIALERPGGTADGLDYSNSIGLENLKPVFKFPNLTAHYRNGGDWGYVQIAGLAKSMKWKDTADIPGYNLSGSALGLGFSLSTVVNAGKKVKIKFQGGYGKGIENYIADAPADIGLQSNSGNPGQPVKGKPLPVWSFFSFAEMKWTPQLQSSAGYSMEVIENSDLQSPNDFRRGQYALVNLRYYPVNNVMMGIEYQYGRRNNFTDGFHSTTGKIQLSFKFNFSAKFYSP